MAVENMTDQHTNTKPMVINNIKVLLLIHFLIQFAMEVKLRHQISRNGPAEDYLLIFTGCPL